MFFLLKIAAYGYKVFHPAISFLNKSSYLASFAEFYYFYIADGAGIEREADDGFHLVETFLATGSGIDVQESELRIRHDFQNMRMPANVEPGRVLLQQMPHARSVAPGVAADVGDEHVHGFAGEAQIERITLPEHGAVYVAMYGTQGFERG